MSFNPSMLTGSVGMAARHHHDGSVSETGSTMAAKSLTRDPSPEIGGTDPSNTPGMGLGS